MPLPPEHVLSAFHAETGATGTRRAQGDQLGPVWDNGIKVGDVVQIIDGAFMGQEGRVVEIENNKVKIMINMFGSETAAELELYQIAEL